MSVHLQRPLCAGFRRQWKLCATDRQVCLPPSIALGILPHVGACRWEGWMEASDKTSSGHRLDKQDLEEADRVRDGHRHMTSTKLESCFSIRTVDLQTPPHGGIGCLPRESCTGWRTRPRTFRENHTPWGSRKGASLVTAHALQLFPFPGPELIKCSVHMVSSPPTL